MVTTAVTPSRQGQAWSTLRLMRVARFVLLVLDVLLFFAFVSAVSAHRSALQTLNRDTVPSIVAAQHIRSAMADMDADAADELLSSGSMPTLVQAYENRRVETARALIAAAENITYGDAERLPLQSLQVGLGTYERLVQRARDLHTSDRAESATAYQEAAGVMDNVLLPSADALDKANNDVLEKTYQGESFRSSGSRLLVVLLGGALLAVLVAAQMLLSQRMHRTLNPPLLLATVLTLLLGLFGLGNLMRAHQALKTGKEDAFASIHVLWRARADGDIARAEEGRYLLEGGRPGAAAQGFRQSAGAVARWPGELSAAQLLAALREGRHIDGFSGLLADEINNITFIGERQAALATLDDWQQFVALHNRVTQLEAGGQPQRALELCTGTAPGGEGWIFAQFDQALAQTLTINQNAFEQATVTGQSALRYLVPATGVVALVLALLVVAGFAPRIREYQ